MTKYTRLLTSLIFSLGFILLSPNCLISVSAQVVINEFESWNSSGDWIEIYAVSDTDISGWIVRDSANSIVKTLPAGVVVGPSTSPYYVVDVGNRLNKDGDVIKLLKNDDSTLVDQIAYGGDGQVCIPNESETIGRYPDANSTIERFKLSSKGESNNSELDPCPSPTSIPKDTETPTPKPTITSKPTLTPKPTNTDTPTPIQKIFLTNAPPEIKSELISGTVDKPVLLENVEEIASDVSSVSDIRPEVLSGKTSKNKPPVFAIALMVIGVVLSGFSIYPILVKLKKGYNLKNEKQNNK